MQGLSKSNGLLSACAGFSGGDVTVYIASRDLALRPALAKGVDWRILPDRETVRVGVVAEHASTLIDNIRATGAVAVVLRLFGTHRAIQLKSDKAFVAPAKDDDLASARAYQETYISTVATLGFPRDLLRAYISCEPRSLMEISFKPNHIFVQAPGCGAGAVVTDTT
jgi:hypothetical protein